MQYEFSKHSLEQMEARNISRDIVSRILEKPDQVEEVNSKRIYQSIIEFENKNKYLVRIFVNIEKTPNFVITVYKTSNIKKYYESKI